jgi:hypothetical protein
VTRVEPGMTRTGDTSTLRDQVLMTPFRVIENGLMS